MNNITLYLFGKLVNGFDVSIKDHTQVWLRELGETPASQARIWIKRQEQLMYYAYLTPLSSGGCFGVCLVLNGVAFCTFSRLFSCLQDFTEQLILRGDMIGLDERGDVVAQARDFQSVLSEVNDAQARLRHELGSLQDLVILPPLDYEEIDDDWQTHDLAHDTEHEIFSDSVGRKALLLLNSKASDSASMQSYRQRLAKLYAQKEEMEERLNEQEKMTAIATQQKEEAWKEKNALEASIPQAPFLYSQPNTKSGEGCGNGCGGCFLVVLIFFGLLYLNLMMKCT